MFCYRQDYQQECQQQMQLFKRIYGSGTTALIISNKEIEDRLKIVKSLEESGLLIKEINKAIKNKTKEQIVGFLPILLGTLAASMFQTALTGGGIIRAGEGIITAGDNF